MFTFTEFVPDTKTRNKIGISLIVLTCLDILINLGVITILTLVVFVRKAKMFYLGWKHAKTTKERTLELLERAKIARVV